MARELTTGRAPFRDWTLWCGVDGELGRGVPIIVVPAGPGIPHEASRVALDDAPVHRPIVFFDPSGAGRSDRPHGVAWTLDLFVDEIEAIVAHLGLSSYHLYGSSFAGLVSLAYALRRPRGLASIAVIGATSSMPASRAAIRRQIEKLPDDAQRGFSAGEGTVAYARAYHLWASRHLCRVPFRPELVQAMRTTNFEAFHQLKGTGPIGFGGALKDFELTPRLGEIEAPVLLICGEHDAVNPHILESMHRALADSRTLVVEGCSHMVHHEAPQRVFPAIFSFFDEIDARR